MYEPNRLSLSENLWSTRAVRKFSLTTCWPAKVNTPRSPLLPTSGFCGVGENVNYAAGRLPSIGGVALGQHGEFLICVHTQAPSQDAAGLSVGVIVGVEAVQTIVILLRPGARNPNLLPNPAFSPFRPRREVRLC